MSRRDSERALLRGCAHTGTGLSSYACECVLQCARVGGGRGGGAGYLCVPCSRLTVGSSSSHMPATVTIAASRAHAHTMRFRPLWKDGWRRKRPFTGLNRGRKRGAPLFHSPLVAARFAAAGTGRRRHRLATAESKEVVPPPVSAAPPLASDGYLEQPETPCFQAHPNQTRPNSSALGCMPRRIRTCQLHSSCWIQVQSALILAS